jgi:hypothetical protein
VTTKDGSTWPSSSGAADHRSSCSRASTRSEPSGPYSSAAPSGFCRQTDYKRRESKLSLRDGRHRIISRSMGGRSLSSISICLARVRLGQHDVPSWMVRRRRSAARSKSQSYCTQGRAMRALLDRPPRAVRNRRRPGQSWRGETAKVRDGSYRVAVSRGQPPSGQYSSTPLRPLCHVFPKRLRRGISESGRTGTRSPPGKPGFGAGKRRRDNPHAGRNDLRSFLQQWRHAACACWLTSLCASLLSLSSVFFSSLSVVSRSFTVWFKPSSAAHVLSVP